MTENSSESNTSVFDWLTLERVPNVGPLTTARLVNAFGSPRRAMEADPEEILRRTGLKEKLAQSISGFVPPTQEILKDLDIMKKLSVKILTRWDKDYPQNLLEIYDPPAILFVRGNILGGDTRAVAMVGTRNPSSYGIEMAERITHDLVRAGVTIVSGLARGIDTACHKTALKAGGRTIGVLGCGIDVCYPRENMALIEEMAEKGAVMSEFRPRTPPLATNFYRRNRIVSGLTKGTVVVEAAPRSGSLITAAHAIDQNRDVFAVPGKVLDRRSWGPNHLLKQGAAVVESADDILAGLFAQVGSAPREVFVKVEQDFSDLSETARQVMETIGIDPTPIDSLCETFGIDAGKLLGILLELELRGLVRQYPGKMFAREP